MPLQVYHLSKPLSQNVSEKAPHHHFFQLTYIVRKSEKGGLFNNLIKKTSSVKYIDVFRFAWYRCFGVLQGSRCTINKLISLKKPVYKIEYQVVQSAGSCTPDVHSWSLSDRIQPFQYLKCRISRRNLIVSTYVITNI